MARAEFRCCSHSMRSSPAAHLKVHTLPLAALSLARAAWNGPTRLTEGGTSEASRSTSENCFPFLFAADESTLTQATLAMGKEALRSQGSRPQAEGCAYEYRDSTGAPLTRSLCNTRKRFSHRPRLERRRTEPDLMIAREGAAVCG